MATANDLNISQPGIVVFDGTATFTGRTLTAGTNISISNGNGVSGNPVISATGGGGGWSPGSPYYFSAYVNGSVSNVTGDGTVYTVIFNNADANVGSAYNTSTGIFTAPVAGFYSFTTTIGYLSLQGSSATDIITGVQGNHYAFRLNQYDNLTSITTTPFVTSNSFMIKMAANDTISITAAAYGTTKSIGISGEVPINNGIAAIFSGFIVSTL